MRILIVSNRLPFTVEVKEDTVKFQHSAGGLVSGISSYLDSIQSGGEVPSSEYLWIGWPGVTVADKWKSIVIERSLAEFHSHPVFFSETTMEKFYQGFCNKTIWPLFHYFPAYASYEEEAWRSYGAVNETFARAVADVARPGDIIWIHDYHLMLLPRLLRDRMPDAAIGFFLHIPFPSFEIYRLLPADWRRELLEGLLGADVIGLHTHHYTQYLLRSVLRVLGHDHSMGQIAVGNRVVAADTFPMGIDFEKYSRTAASPDVQAEASRMKHDIGDKKVVLSVDRLDYTKGISHRLEGYEQFLEENRDWWKKVVLVLLVVPSRVAVAHYQEMKNKIDELVGRINGRFGSVGWTPIIYQYRFFPLQRLTALYSISDVALITPLRDGMNLVAKEYIAARTDQTGVLILSEMAGASSELGEALAINPNYTAEISKCLKIALEMPKEEQVRRNRIMQKRLQRYSVRRWAREFISKLQSVKELQRQSQVSVVGEKTREELIHRFARARSRLVFLDYDGTLVPFDNEPHMAAPNQRVLRLLLRLSADQDNNIVLLTGRDRATMDRWFGNLPLCIAAEHGTFVREPDREWVSPIPLTADWKEHLLPILEVFVDRLPGAFIEEKEYSLVWHYRKADPEQRSMRAKELLDHLMTITANMNVQILPGNKTIEVRNMGVNRANVALQQMEKKKHDFIMAVGGDWTDEDVFTALPRSAVCIKVGPGQSHATVRVDSPEDVLELLEQMVSGCVARKAGSDDKVDDGKKKFNGRKDEDHAHQPESQNVIDHYAAEHQPPKAVDKNKRNVPPDFAGTNNQGSPQD